MWEMYVKEMYVCGKMYVGKCMYVKYVCGKMYVCNKCMCGENVVCKKKKKMYVCGKMYVGKCMWENVCM